MHLCCHGKSVTMATNVNLSDSVKVLERQNLKIRFALAYKTYLSIISVVTQKLSKFL